MRLAYAFAFVLAANAPASAGSEESGIISIFEAVCLNNISEFSRTAPMVERLGLTEITEPDLSVLLNGGDGRAWISRPGAQPRFFLKLLDTGVCTVSAPYADKGQVQELFLKFFRHKLLSEEPAGTEMHQIFAVTHPDGKTGADGHGLAILQTSQMASEPGISLLAVTEKAAEAAGLAPLTYP